MALYLIGDVQGCDRALERLLAAIDFSPSRDRLVLLGDLVNRGPDSLGVLRRVMALDGAARCVLGNHDLHLLGVAAGVRAPHRSDTFDKLLAAPDRDTLLDWLLHRPLIHREHGFTMVHAGIPPQWSVSQAMGYAGEVEAVLRSPDCLVFFQAMYGNEPAVWSDDLSGMTRLRVITNYLTRMRFCTKKGVLDLTSKGTTPNKSKKKLAPWFAHPGRKTAGDKILFGHWASLEGVTGNPNAIALDTGCVWGRKLSLYQLETGQWTQCQCRNGKCRE